MWTALHNQQRGVGMVARSSPSYRNCGIWLGGVLSVGQDLGQSSRSGSLTTCDRPRQLAFGSPARGTAIFQARVLGWR